MRTMVLSLMLLALGMLHASGQEPEPGPVPAPAPEPVPVPGPPAAPAPVPPPLLVEPLETELVPGQPHFGAPILITPAHRLAMMEAGEPMFATDARVKSASVLLERLTAGYVEDATRISELTIRVCGQIRAANRPASPFEMLNGALTRPRPASLSSSVPRQFEHFAALYRQARVVKGMDHPAAVSALAAPR